MSLIVAHSFGKAIYIVSDTKLTHAYGGKIPPTEGVLKSTILSPNICVSFAGQDGFADEALQSYSSGSHKLEHFDQIVSHFLEWHRKAERLTDFIIAFGSPYYSLVEIKEGVGREVTNSWIGDQSAFEKFQQHYHQHITPSKPPLGVAALKCTYVPEGDESDTLRYNQLLESMKAVVADSEIRNVGDFAIAVGYDKHRFRYIDYVDVLTHQIDFDLLPQEKDGWAAIPFGTTEQGGYAFNFMSAIDENSLAAMFFLQGNVGLVFKSSNGGLLRPLSAIKEISPLDFVEKVQAEHGVHLGCMFVGAHSYRQRAWLRLNAGELGAALEDCEKGIEMEPLSPDGHRLRGLIFSRMGEVDKAITDFTKAIIIAPDAATYNNRGLAYRNKGLIEQAISDYTRAIEIYPRYATGFKNRSLAYQLKGDIKAAASDLTRYGELTEEIDVASEGAPSDPARLARKAERLSIEFTDGRREMQLIVDNVMDEMRIDWPLGAEKPNIQIKQHSGNTIQLKNTMLTVRQKR